MTSNNGQGAVPSGGCLMWHAVLRVKVSESWNRDWNGCDGEWGRLTCCTKCVQTSAWGKPRKGLLDTLLPFSGGSGGEGVRENTDMIAQLFSWKEDGGTTMVYSFFLHSASTFSFFHLTQYSQGPVLQVWLPNQESSLSARLWLYFETFTPESLRGLWVDNNFTLPGKLMNWSTWLTMNADIWPMLCCVLCLVPLSCLTLCDPMDCSPPGFSVHWVFQARVLEWVAILFSRGSSRPRDQTRVSCIAGRFFTVWATREA